LGERERLMEALMHLGLVRQLRQDFGAAQELAHRVLALAQPGIAEPAVAGAHLVLGITFFHLGELQASRKHLELAGAPLNAESVRDFAAGQYAESATASLTTTLLLLGYPAAAERMSREFVAAMRRLSNPVSIQRSLLRGTAVHRLLRDSRTALKQAEEALSIATDIGMTISANLAAFSRGKALADGGRGQEGIAEMSRTIASLQGTQVISMSYAQLAESLGQNGRPAEGLAAVAWGLEEVERSGSRVSLPHLYQVQGELVLLSDPASAAEAERHFRAAIDVAREQQARFWELRATISLARLVHKQGKIDEARAMLAAIYDWFTEGFEFPDLKEARALLDELGG
jgi:tetratricopeptide (TPR) repeat protein